MRQRHYEVVGPLILITIGLLVLLSNVGALPFGVWDLLLRLWPLLLVAWGLEALFGRRSAFGAMLVVVVTIALGAGVTWYAFATDSLNAPPGETRPISQPLAGASEADVTIDMSIGRLALGALSDSPLLLDGRVTEGGGLSAQADSSMAGGVLRYTLRSEGFAFLPGGRVEWQLDLNGRVPLSLNIDHSIGDADIDLSQLNVRHAEIHTGVGESTLTVPGSGRPTIEVDQSVGGLRVIVPDGTPARIRVDSGIGGVDVGPRFRKVGSDVYETEDYAGADERVDIIIDHSVGEVIIR